MIITVELMGRQWQVIDPQASCRTDYPDGPQAFDAAAALASDHHQRTGAASSVRVTVEQASVEALRFS